MFLKLKHILRVCANACQKKHWRFFVGYGAFAGLVIFLVVIGFVYGSGPVSSTLSASASASARSPRSGALLATPSTPPAIGSWATASERALARAEAAQGISFSYSDLLATIKSHQVRFATLNTTSGSASVILRNNHSYSTSFPPTDSTQLGAQLTKAGAGVSYSSGTGSELASFLETLLLLAVVFGVIMFVLRKRDALGAKHTRAPGAAAVIPSERFSDVAGCDEAVEELREMVDFMLHPERYEALGARSPKGIILYGAPGVGKTLLAKAVAGESGVPFYATSGSDFVEMYVGVGAARARKLFAAARKTGGVVFIDEIDAVGKKRGGYGSSEDDRTLNQLFVELDGFIALNGVMVMAATNRLDTLDPALLRPGRFSRHVHVGTPSKEGRLAILRVHSRNKPLAESVDLEALALSSSGASGADLAEMLNEGAIMAARENAPTIEHKHLREGFLRVIAGPRKISSMLAAGERETVAYHESGHVLCAELCPTCDPTTHASINPRGAAAGLALIGRSDRTLHNEQHIHEQLIYILGGRAAEYVYSATVSSGAANDLQQANALARQAVDEYGFSHEVGQIISGPSGFSEDMRGKSDAEVRRLVEDAYRDAVAMVTEHREQLDRLAQALLAAGDIDRPEIVVAMAGSVSQPRHPRLAHQPVNEHAPAKDSPRSRHWSGHGRALRLPELALAAFTAFTAARKRKQRTERI